MHSLDITGNNKMYGGNQRYLQADLYSWKKIRRSIVAFYLDLKVLRFCLGWCSGVSYFSLFLRFRSGWWFEVSYFSLFVSMISSRVMTQRLAFFFVFMIPFGVMTRTTVISGNNNSEAAVCHDMYFYFYQGSS